MSKNKLIIALSGKSGTGKDTYANMLRYVFTEHGLSCRILHFADALKSAAAYHFNIPISLLMDTKHKDAPFSDAVSKSMHKPEFYNSERCTLPIPEVGKFTTIGKATKWPSTPREALLIMGNGGGVVPADTWRGTLISDIKRYNADVVIVADLRYKTEVECLQAYAATGSKLITVRLEPFRTAPSKYFDKEKSEVDLDSFELDIHLTPEEGKQGITDALTHTLSKITSMAPYLNIDASALRL